MKEKNKVTVYLLKDVEKMSYLIKDIKILKEKNLYIESHANSQAKADCAIVIGESKGTPPLWVSEFFGKVEGLEKVFTANARVVLLKRLFIKGARVTFAICFGHGKYMLEDDVIQEGFGLRVVLNTISHDTIRHITRTNIAGNHKSSNEQLPQMSEIDEFGIDVNADLVRNLSGSAIDKSYTEGMLTGGDGLSVTTKVNYDTIDEFLIKTYHQYNKKEYKKRFAWIDYIKVVKSKEKIEKLNNELIRHLTKGTSQFKFAVPEVIDREETKGFRVQGDPIEYDDIYTKVIMNSFKGHLESVSMLTTKKIYIISTKDEQANKSWSAYKCIHGECEFEGQTYCLTDGKWYIIDNDYTDKINRNYESAKVSSLILPDRKLKDMDENQYSKEAVKSNKEKYLLMDRVLVSTGIAKNPIELCDILTTNGELIHVKPYGGSTTLSHLFNQGLVSMRLLRTSNSFVNRANEEIKIQGGEQFQITNTNKIKVIYAIITENKEVRPHIPFFSKVTFAYIQEQFQLVGIPVEIVNIYDAHKKERKELKKKLKESIKKK